MRWGTAMQAALRGSRIRGGHPNDGLITLGVAKYSTYSAAASVPIAPTFFFHRRDTRRTGVAGRANKEAMVKQEGHAAECIAACFAIA